MSRTPPPSHPAATPSLRVLVIAVVLLNLVVFGLTALALYASHQQRLQNARTSAKNLSLVLQRSFDDAFQRIQVGLHSSAIEIERQLAQGGIDEKRLNHYLVLMHKSMVPARALRVTNPRGAIRYGVGVVPGERLDLDTSFTSLRQDPGATALLSDLIIDPDSGQLSIVFAHRLNDPKGKFAGVVYAPVPSRDLSDFFAALDLGTKGVASLRKGFGDFAIIARYPEKISGTNIVAAGNGRHSPTFARMVAGGETHHVYEDVTGVDRIYRTFSVRRLEKYNYYVGLGLAHEDLFAGWRREAARMIAIAFVFLVASIFLAREQRRAWVRQQETMALLTAMATQDALTGIPNRRRLNEALEEEWLRAQRDQHPVSLVMVDIDNFKAYNDHYGHGQGDVCLRGVAEVLNDTVRRPGDLVARYGGEEFVMLLPNTDAFGARQVAERARQLIEGLKLPHAFSPTSPWVTVSAGVFTVIPQERLEAAMLLTEADTLLYQAKNAGRNRVVAAKNRPPTVP